MAAAPAGITPIQVIVQQDGEANIDLNLNLVVVPAPLPPVLDPPGGVTARAVSSSQINLAWTAAVGATGYEVDQEINGSFQQIARVDGGTTSYSVTGLSPSTTYEFQVGSFNAANPSNPTYPGTFQTATTLAPPTEVAIQGIRVGTHQGKPVVTVIFSMPVDPSTAEHREFYAVNEIVTKRVKKRVTTVSKPLAIKAYSLDSTHTMVMLTLAKANNGKAQVAVNGAIAPNDGTPTKIDFSEDVHLP